MCTPEGAQAGRQVGGPPDQALRKYTPNIKTTSHLK